MGEQFFSKPVTVFCCSCMFSVLLYSYFSALLRGGGGRVSQKQNAAFFESYKSFCISLTEAAVAEWNILLSSLSILGSRCLVSQTISESY